MLSIHHEHSRKTMAGNDFEESCQCDLHDTDSGYAQSPQPANQLWKNGLPIQQGALTKEDAVFDIPEDCHLSPVGTSNSSGDGDPQICTNRTDTSNEADPGYNTDPGYDHNDESAFSSESDFPFQRERSTASKPPKLSISETLACPFLGDVILDIPENHHLPSVGTSMAASVHSTLPLYFSPMLVRASLELNGPDASNETVAESQVHDNNNPTLPLPGNQDAIATNSKGLVNGPLGLNVLNTSYSMEEESQVHDNGDLALPLATRRYLGIEVNVMLAGINGAAIVGLSSFAPKDSSLKHMFEATVGIGFFGSLFAVLSMRKPKQATILSKIGIIGTSSAILVALGTEFGVNIVGIVLVCLIFAVVMMISDLWASVVS